MGSKHTDFSVKRVQFRRKQAFWIINHSQDIHLPMERQFQMTHVSQNHSAQRRQRSTVVINRRSRFCMLETQSGGIRQLTIGITQIEDVILKMSAQVGGSIKIPLNGCEV